jgi:hypothetical protein
MISKTNVSHPAVQLALVTIRVQHLTVTTLRYAKLGPVPLEAAMNKTVYKSPSMDLTC